MIDHEKRYPWQSFSVDRMHAFAAGDIPEDVKDIESALADEHNRHPFSPVDPMSAIERALSVMEDYGIDEKRLDVWGGYVEASAASTKHVWLALDERVIDVILPVNDDNFPRELRNFISGSIRSYPADNRAEHDRSVDRDFKHYTQQETDFEARALGYFPEPSVRYLGAITLDAYN